MGRGASSEGDGGVGECWRQTPGVEDESVVKDADADADANADADADADADASLKRKRGEEGGDGDVSMVEEDAEHRRSDHERQEAVELPRSSTLYKLSLERKCPQPNIQVKMISARLKRNKHTAIPPTQPHPTQNLLHLYNLQRIQSSVARRDPHTGDKINKLRKSYEGKVKDLGLEGRNKASKGQAELEGLVDPGWDDDLGDGRTAWQDRMGDTMLGQHKADSMLGLLDTALDFKPGQLPGPEHSHWRGLLGLDESLPKPTPTTTTTGPNLTTGGPSKPPTSTLLSKTAPATAASASRNSAPASPRNHHDTRPERAGKKRRYDESSYAGYQEGYEDDGYSTGNGVDEAGRRSSGGAGGGGGKRQKRKVSGRLVEGFYALPSGDS